MASPSEPIVEQLGPAACRTYVLACRRSKRAIVVDPLDEDHVRTVEHMDRAGYRVAAVVDTHTHADHVSGGARLAEATGAPYALHEATDCAAVTDRLADGRRIDVGGFCVEAFHTPGHTPDSVSLRAGRFLLTGDTLFLAQDGAGRLDLPGGDPGAHWDSLRRLAGLGDDIVVLPGHDYNGLDAATLGQERVRNPRFQDVTREEYVAWHRAIAMPTPDWMLAVLARNLGRNGHHPAPAVGGLGGPLDDLVQSCADGASGGACQAHPGGRVPLVTVEEAARRLAAAPSERPFLLDVREPAEYHGPFGRHAPGTVLVPLATLPHRLDALPDDPAREVLVICKSGGRSARAAEFLIESGRRRVFNIVGGTDAWVQAGLPVER